MHAWVRLKQQLTFIYNAFASVRKHDVCIEMNKIDSYIKVRICDRDMLLEISLEHLLQYISDARRTKNVMVCLRTLTFQVDKV